MNAQTDALDRSLGVWGAVWMGLGSIVGTGVFVSLAVATDLVGPAIVLATALAAFVATCNGLSSAQLAAAHPVSGGTYEYGHRYVHPAAGFSAGWMFLLAKGASAATAALGCIGYLVHLVGLNEGLWIRFAAAPGLVLVMAALVASGIRRSNALNLIIVSVTLASLGLFVALGLRQGLANGTIGSPSQILGAVDGPGPLLHAVALMFVAYAGYGRIATLGEEVREPRKTIPKAIVATLVVSMVLYVSVSVVAVAVAGDGFAIDRGAAAAPLEQVASRLDASFVAPVVAGAAVTAMLGVLLNLLLGLSRVVLAMARRAEMPTMFAQVDEKTKSPARAVWLVGIIVAGLTLIGDVKTTWSFAAFAVLLYYSITNLSALRLPPEDRLYPRLFSWAGLIACLSLAWFVEWQIWLIGTGVLAAGFAFRFVLLQRRDNST